MSNFVPVVQKWLGTNKFVHTKNHTGIYMGLLCTTGTVVMHLHCGFLCGVRWRHSRAQNSELHFLVNFFTSLRKDIVANYTSIWTLFSPSVRGPDVLRNALNTSPQDSQMWGGYFPKRKKSAAEFCQILRMVTIQTVINSAHVYEHNLCTWLYPAGMHCPWWRDDTFDF